MSPETPTPAPESAAPTRRRRGPVLLLLTGALAGAAAGAGGMLLATRERAPEGAPAEAKAVYQCPMHPSIVQDHPGDCPICGMKLVEVAAPGTARAASEEPAQPEKTTYQCPMHPTIVQDHPGDCPICGMKLVPVKVGGAEAHAEHEGAGAHPELAPVEIDPARQQLIGLRTARAELGPIGGSWRTVGRVAVDERRIHHVNVKVGGFVEHDHANFVGKEIRKGEPLFSVYSPELLAAQEEYLLALRTRDALARSGATPSDGDTLVEAARRKLELWDVPDSEIRRLERTGEPSKELMFYSPVSGVVVKRDVVPGMRLEPGAMPYEITDLSRVWVLADVYETELRHVKVGMPATLTLKAYPDRTFRGKVAFIDPILDPRTRTVKVRLEFPNPGGELKPEMFGEVVLHGRTREGLRIPADAVIHSGTTNVVFASLGQGKFLPLEVKLGDGDAEYVEVLEGLEEGEAVVTRANFLVDSESRLRASLATMTQGSEGAPAAPAADPHAGHGGR